MKTFKIYYSFLILFFFNLTFSNVEGQGIYISTGGTITTTGNSTIEITNGDFINDGSFVSSTDNDVIMSGSSNSTVGGTSTTTFNDLSINNSSDVKLSQNIRIQNAINFIIGKLNLNGKIITLEENATLVNETNSNRVYGTSGYLQTTRTFAEGDLTLGVNIGNMGMELTTTKSIGTMTLIRGHQIFTGGNSGAGKSIARYFDFTLSSKGNSGLDASIKMYYFEDELNGLTEDELVQFQTSDNTNWTIYEVTTIDPVNNFILTTGIDSLKKTTLSESGSSGNALPIKLGEFYTNCENNMVKITWKTSSEENSDFYLLQRSIDLNDFQTIEKVKAAGNSNTVIEYSVKDDIKSNETQYYRLIEYDFNGNYTIFKTIQSNCTNNRISNSINVKPNPFTDNLNLDFIAETSGEALIQLFSMDGRIVYSTKIEVNEGKRDFDILVPDLIAGIYTLTIFLNESNKFIKLVKL